MAVASAGLVAPLGLAPTVLSGQANQYHAQDELGQYSYGYSGGPSSKVETKTADGVVRGAYSYIDGNGLIQSVNYVADPINGFRTAATNLPVGPAPAPAQLVAARSIVPAGAIVGAPGIAYSNHLLAAPALVGAPIYHAAAAPLHNGAGEIFLNFY